LMGLRRSLRSRLFMIQGIEIALATVRIG